MADVGLPPPSDLRKMLDYDPDSGLFVWRTRGADTFSAGARGVEHTARIWNAAFAGRPAMTAHDGRGYLRGKLAGRNHKAHRVAWAMHYGEWPDGEIDHINHDKTDNRIANLRVVSRQENAKNKPRQSNNTSGAVGVSFVAQSGKWQALVKIGSRNKYLGLFATFEEALAARKSAERELGFHENHGGAL